jgi:hypothetical protein
VRVGGGRAGLLTLYPKELSFITHSIVNKIVKTRLQSDRTSV